MTILALDLGTSTGWAMKCESGINSGSISFQNKRHEGAGMRYLKFKKWLTEMKQAGIDEVYFEEVRNHKGADAAHVFGGFMAVLMAWCEHHCIPYSSVPVGTIKKSWTGKGNSGKDEMIAAAKEKGFNPVNDDEADALALLHYVTEPF